VPKLVDELSRYCRSGSGTPFDAYHSGMPQSCGIVLEGFLRATMDEVRARQASGYAREALRIIELDDADYFRRGLLRREVTGRISYDEHRDHSTHTLYNYLLGWYIHSHSRRLRTEVARHFAVRGWHRGVQDFGNIWPFLSLVHDIGYLFEGSIDPLSTAVQSDHVRAGVDIVNEFFEHWFWIESCSDSVQDRKIIERLASASGPSLRADSLTAVADGLRWLDDIDTLRASALAQRVSSGFPARSPDCLARPQGLPSDSFDLWEKHYRHFGQPAMARRMRLLGRIFNWLLCDGLGGTGLRMLDHGVCSGLLMLLHSTFYFRVFFGIGNTPPNDATAARVWNRFRVRNIPSGVAVNSLWWWTSVVWATAGAALHNIQQLDRSHLGPWGAKLRRLSLGEDPLTYLGILVDCLQEWDRTTVSRRSIVGGVLPLQGVDVAITRPNGKIRFDFGDRRRAASVRRNLSVALANWNHIVEVGP
jgi:hypothetical protein